MMHFEKHGVDFGAKSAEEYANMASDFLVKAQREKLPTKIAPDGTIRVYDPKTNTFGAYNPDGTREIEESKTVRIGKFSKEPFTKIKYIVNMVSEY